jgi:hypothetical protein
MVGSSNEAKDPLTVVPRAQGFHFYKAIGCCIGVTCCSLEELADALQKVCSEAVTFHFERGDFQNWMRDIIGDNELAKRINVRILQLEVAKGPSVFGEKNKKKIAC